MKYLSLIVLLAVTFNSCQPKQDNGSVQFETDASDAVIEIYDFHVTNRCMMCRAIEDNARQTLVQFFPDEMETGIIEFKVVNVDLPENAAVAQQFQAFGSSLFLKVNKNNQSEIVNLTEFAFMNAMNDQEFQTQLKSKIETYL